MKSLLYVLLMLCCCFPPLQANEFWTLGDEPQRVKNSPIIKILQQKPVVFWVSCDNETYPIESLAEYMQRSFVRWFDVLNYAIGQKENRAQREALAGYEKAIAYGAKNEAFVLTEDESQADVKVYFLKKEVMHEKCRNNRAAACVVSDAQNNAVKIIYSGYPLLKGNKDGKMIYESTNVPVHEIGHVWGLDDLYADKYGTNGREYGSGVKESIMYKSVGITCDDLDGLSTMLYFGAKSQNPAEPDLVLPSFCGEGVVFRNGRIINRGAEVITDIYRLLYRSYCAEGPKAKDIVVSPVDFEHLITTEVFNSCPTDEKDIIARVPYREIAPEQLEQLTGIKLVSLDEKVFYKPLITGEKPLNLFVHIGGEVPAFAYIVDEDKNIIFFFAHLKGGYNWAYNSLFYKDTPLASRNGKQIMIYLRKNPLYAVYWFDNGSNFIPMKMFNKMSGISRDTFEYFRRRFNLFAPVEKWDVWTANAVQKTLSWDKHLTQDFLETINLEQDIKKKLAHTLKK